MTWAVVSASPASFLISETGTVTAIVRNTVGRRQEAAEAVADSDTERPSGLSLEFNYVALSKRLRPPLPRSVVSPGRRLSKAGLPSWAAPACRPSGAPGNTLPHTHRPRLLPALLSLLGRKTAMSPMRGGWGPQELGANQMRPESQRGRTEVMPFAV